MNYLMNVILLCVAVLASGTNVMGQDARPSRKPYLTTQTPITLFSTSDGECEALRLNLRVRPYDYQLKTKDSFTIIHLGPDHPPIVKTVFGTIPATILGTPTMAMSRDGRYAMVANHGFRFEGSRLDRLTYPKGEPLTNQDLTPELLKKQKLSPQLSDMLSLIDVSKPDFPVVQRILFDDHPVHVLPHPDGQHFVTIATQHFYVFRLRKGKLTEVSRTPHPYGLGCFWINPAGDRILSAQNDQRGGNCTVQWFEIDDHKVRHLSEVKVARGVDTSISDTTYILRITPDGKQGFICQRTIGNGSDFCDVMIADLTMKRPAITGVIKQVGDGLESFAFHPNGKMAVATCLENTKNSLAILDIESKPPRLLYHLDAAGVSQGIEFTSEGDRLFLGSCSHGRIEVYDVVGDFELRKNQKFIKVGYGHNSLSIGSRYRGNR